MNLTAEHFPISCSLQTAVMDHFASQENRDDSNILSEEELLGYLRKPHDLDLTPYADLLSQTEKMGDPALPSHEHTAILRWVGEAMHHFEQRFPLEEPLASQVQKLKPLAAAIALTDPDFMQPDAHPLQQLLDAIQERAVGWQPTLGRAGTALEQQVNKAVEAALLWFDSDATDLAAVCASFLAAAERDQSRAERMAKRIVETEVGKVRTAAAKRDAAQMINDCIEKYPIPEEIGDFLKGPWYDSAQLVLLKFSSDSEQWRKITETTETLVDSLQSLEDVAEERRQHVFALVTRLPKEMRRWLLSLHHDTEAVNDAMGIVEFAHLRILRGQTMEVKSVSPIAVGADMHAVARPGLANSLKAIEQGQWFGIDVRKQGTLRVQLALKDEGEQRLLFTNLAGMKVLDYSFEDFDQLIGDKGVMALPAGGAFSLCLAIAAGLDTTEKLDALYASLSPAQEAAATEATEPADSSEQIPEGAGDTGEQETLQDFLAEAAARSQSDAGAIEKTSVPPAAPSETASDPGDEEDLLNAQEQQGLESLIADEPSTDDAPVSDQKENSYFGSTDTQDPQPPGDTTSYFGSSDNTAPDAQPADGGSYFSDPPVPAEAAEERAGDASDAAVEDGFLTEQAMQIDAGDNSANAKTTDTPQQAERPATEPTGDLNLPMGAWLGFHDGATPLMAKLAVHDPTGDVYIFVNRQGIKMREIGGADLAGLISRGLVDILQTASSFREDVDAARRELDT